MENTTNFGLKVYEGDDLFNPLTVENYNTNAIDGAMKENEDAGLQTATELLSGTVHAITRNKPDAGAFRFTAVSRFTAGDTFTVDGVQVSALLTSGEQLPDGAYDIGAEVLATLKGTRLTVYISSASVSTAENAQKLGGELPAYYATATAVEEAQTTATSAGNLASQNQQAISTIESDLGKVAKRTLLWSNPNPTSNFVAQTLSLNINDFDEILVQYRSSTNTARYEESKVSRDLNIGVKTYWSFGNNLSASAVFSRTFFGYFNTNSVTFENGRSISHSGASITDNNAILIPVKIYGIKY